LTRGAAPIERRPIHIARPGPDDDVFAFYDAGLPNTPGADQAPCAVFLVHASAFFIQMAMPGFNPSAIKSAGMLEK
jgi:hypothetical protein